MLDAEGKHLKTDHQYVEASQLLKKHKQGRGLRGGEQEVCSKAKSTGIRTGGICNLLWNNSKNWDRLLDEQKMIKQT